MDLEGKVAIVTGGAVRLGREIVLALADAGINIALHYGRSSQAAAETLAEVAARGARGISIQADLQDPVPAAARVLETTVGEFGRADILVNNAAIFEAGTLGTTTAEQWDRHFTINLKAPFLLCQAFAEQLHPDQRAHIVNIVDWRATRPDPEFTAYSLTKHSLASLTGSLAQQLAPHVQVNAIAPGAVLPPPGRDQAYLDRLAETIPLGRATTAAEITRTLCFLLRSDCITGEILHVAGGQQL